MTECERLVKSGFIEESYLLEEIRNDFLVDSKRKKIWAIELDLLSQFDRICKKYNLKYWLLYGSLLGAIRHNGFIPWDDDMDVGIPRKDYEKFLEVAPRELKDPYFLQTPHTDKGSCFSMARLRNSNTTAVIKAFEDEKFNQGIVFDIFPIDNCPELGVEERFEKIKQYTINGSAYMRRNRKNLTDKDKTLISQYNGKDPEQNYDELQELLSQFENDNTEYVCTHVITTYPCKKEMFLKKDFSETVFVNFEGIKVPIPNGFDNILKTTYGDYMKFPPLSDRGNWHGISTVYEPDISYKEFLKI